MPITVSSMWYIFISFFFFFTLTCSIYHYDIDTNCAFGFARYKWNQSAIDLDKRLNFFESNWAFFAGFGKVSFQLELLFFSKFCQTVASTFFSSGSHLVIDGLLCRLESYCSLFIWFLFAVPISASK